MTFFSLAAVAMFATACERHSASELTGEQPGGPLHPPADVPQNPGGSGPISTEDKNGSASDQKYGEQKHDAPAALGATPKGSSFFPGNK